MKIHKGFQCKSCSSFLSHPIDVCPVCSDQFYWRVVSDAQVSSPQHEAFVASMINLVEGRVTPEFLTHGGQLWLPYRFWSVDPSGNTLLEFVWIEDLEVFQHQAKAPKSEAQTGENAKKEPAPWDTLPKMPLPDFSKMKPKAQAVELESAREADTLTDAPVPKPIQHAEKLRSKQAPTRADGSTFAWRDLFVPLMVFLLFLFLSLSYLTLLYYRNHMTPDAPEQSYLEGTHERFILS